LKSGNRWWLIGALVMMIIPILWFVFSVDVDQVFNYLTLIDLRAGPAVAALILLLVGYALHAKRWQWLLSGKSGYLDTFHAANVGHLVNLGIPAGAGHVARVVVLGHRQPIPVAEGASSVAVERWLELIMRVLALAAAIALGAGLAMNAGTIGGPILLIVGSMVIMLLMVKYQTQIIASWPKQLARLPGVTEDKAAEQLTNLLVGLSGVASVRGLGVAFLLSVTTWVVFYGFHYLTLQTLNIQNLPTQRALAIAMGSLALASPTSAIRPGSYANTIVVPMTVAGYEAAAIAAYAILLHLPQIVVLIALGAWALLGKDGINFRELMPGSKPPDSEQAEPDDAKEAPMTSP